MEEPRAVGDPMHVETSFVRNLGGLIRVRQGMPDRLMKDLAQGERRSDGRGPDTAPGYRVERTGSRAPSGATEQDGTVHGIAASHHHRSP